MEENKTTHLSLVYVRCVPHTPSCSKVYKLAHQTKFVYSSLLDSLKACIDILIKLFTNLIKTPLYVIVTLCSFCKYSLFKFVKKNCANFWMYFVLLLWLIWTCVVFSMAECDAVCSRLTIMVNGKLMCMGSGQRIKNKYENFPYQKGLRILNDTCIYINI